MEKREASELRVHELDALVAQMEAKIAKLTEQIEFNRKDEK